MLNLYAHLRVVLGAALLLTMGVVEATAATVLYREIFPNNTANDILNPTAATETGWRVHRTGGGVLTNEWRLANNQLDTSATAGVAVNSNPQRTPLDNRSYVWIGATGDINPLNTNYLIWTDEYSALASLTSIEWWQNNGSVADAMRIAVKVDGDWFISNSSFANTTANVKQQFTLDVLTETWSPLLFTPGSELAVGAADTLMLPTGAVEAFGWYTATRNNTLRLDSFTLNGVLVPEPSTWGMGALGLGLALLAVRRRRGANREAFRA